jgi:gamma-glutamyltranspeptidase/glutathione hydrolase
MAAGSEGARYKRFAVATDHPAASEAGAQLLRQGGNAADAAAAAMLALGVVSPAGSGLGGGGFALYYRKQDRSLTFLDFREMAPRSARPDTFSAQAGDTPDKTAQRSQRGGLAVAVPGEPLGIETLQRRFGKLGLKEATAPAFALADGGFAVSAHVTRMLGFLGLGKDSDALFSQVFGPPAQPQKEARNPALARTLKLLGRRGARVFYTGRFGQALVAKVKGQGGLLDTQDLAAYRVLSREPLRTQAFGRTWVTAPAPSAGGYTLASSLDMLERLSSGKLPKGAQRFHMLVESWKGPYLDRARYFGDPDHTDLRLNELNGDARRRERALRFHPVLASSPALYALPLPEPAPPPTVAVEDHGTSHLCVVDKEGNVAAVTTTVNLAFGAQLSVGGLWLNDQMDDFAREVGKENAFGLVGGAANLPGPGKRPVSSMVPTIVFEGDAPVLCVGGSGGSRIPTAVEQVALYVLHDGLSPEQALMEARVHHQGSPDRVELRGGDESLLQNLRARGHDARQVENSANVQLIAIGADGLRAASDPNKGGAPSGE